MKSHSVIVSLVIGLGSLLYSCKGTAQPNTDYSIRWEKKREITFKHNGEKISGTNNQIITIKGKYYLFNHESEGNRMALYDYETGEKYKTIRIQGMPKSPHWVRSVDFVNVDSIFVLLHPKIFKLNYLDSTLFRVDTSGKILDWYLPHNPNFMISENTNLSKSTALMYNFFNINLKFYRAGKLFLPLDRPYNIVGDSVMKAQPAPLACYLDITKKPAAYVEPKVLHPSYAYDYYFTRDLVRSRITLGLKEDELLYSFGYSSLIKNYNLKTKQVSEHYLHSVLVDTIQPFFPSLAENSKKVLQDDKKQGMYCQELIRNPFRQEYYRVMRLNPPANAQPSDINDPIYGIMLIDANLNKQAEGLMPEGTETRRFILPAPEGILMYESEKTKNCGEDCFVMVAYTPTLVKESPLKAVEAYRSKQLKAGNVSVQDTGWLAYFKQFPAYKPNLPKQVVVFVPTQYTCPNCKKGFYEELERLCKTYSTIRTIFAAESPAYYAEELKNFPFLKDKPYFWVDEKRLYQKYVLVQSPNPVAFFIKKGTIVQQKTINPATAVETFKEVENFAK